MSELQVYIVLGVFATVILVIAFNVIDMAVAALVGVSVLIALRILDEQDMLSAARTATGPTVCCSAAWWSRASCRPRVCSTWSATCIFVSSLLANVPVAAASIVMVKGYLVAAEFVPDIALSDQFTQWPPVTIPVFVGMMFGATLGGNATLIGAAANIVSAGICAREGRPVTFVTFLRYGLPVTLVQLAASALYVLVLARVSH
ncbi:hypothetical protein [Paraburkholderia sp. SIMBA_030]|uniref:hypothetical protein n=1 Tax=Paraburkholderia sp. SIMBA_030 TaxID=3085773 RepID=UPI00397A1654